MSTKVESGNEGFASVVVALILVLVFSLITLGFSQIARREQQNALNQQLATKATYAAESGINQIVKQIRAGVTNWSNTDCAININSAGIGARTTDSQVTCALVTLNPTSVITQNTPAQQSRISYVESSDGSNINKINFSWGSACQSGDEACNSSNSNFLSELRPNPGSGSWTYPPVIQLSITALNSYKRADLINNTFNVFLYPASVAAGTSSIPGNFANNANKFMVKCSTTNNAPPLPCSTDIDLSSYNSSKFMVRYMPIYRDANNKYSLPTAGGGSLQIKNSQAEIDVTAKSQDVVKRLKVRVPIYSTSTTSTSAGSETPDFVLQAVNICKRIKTAPSPGSTTFSAPVPEADSACNGLIDGPIVWN